MNKPFRRNVFSPNFVCTLISGDNLAPKRLGEENASTDGDLVDTIAAKAIEARAVISFMVVSYFHKYIFVKL